jgi:IclR family KDG regulon transcriptional repressor
MHSTGVGKLLLLNYTPAQLEEFVRKKGLEMLTQNTITTYGDLLEELKTVREQGYAMDNEECEDGARCIAAPIKDYTGKIIAGISISGPINRITLKRIKPLKDILLEISSKISEKFGYTQQ